MIKLGDKVRDTITGFEGIATAHARYLTGCEQFIVQPRCVKTNKKLDTKNYPKGVWLDIDRLEVVKEGAALVAVETAGGPQTDAPAPR